MLTYFKRIEQLIQNYCLLSLLFLTVGEIENLSDFLGKKAIKIVGRPGFNPRSRHTKDFKNGTWYLLT